MVSIDKAQQLLGDKGYSPAQIKQMTFEYIALANILIDQYLDKGVDNINELTT
jgi:hypothetical protein